MDAQALFDLLADGPVIAAVKDGEGLSAALESSVPVIFLLYGDILTVGEAAAQCRAAGKAVFVHLDLVEGLAQKEIAADFIARSTEADGIISTRPALTRRARELGLLAVQRIFLLDSMALPKIIRKICISTGKPVIAGGLISDKEDVTGSLGAGAIAVSSTNPAVWNM